MSRKAKSKSTVCPKKYAHGFVVLCFVVVMQSFIMNSHEVFIHIHQGCFAGTGAIVRMSQCQWSKPDGYWKISQCITTTKHSKAKTVCIFLGIYCIYPVFRVFFAVVTSLITGYLYTQLLRFTSPITLFPILQLIAVESWCRYFALGKLNGMYISFASSVARAMTII